MNELLEQFLAETRELVQSATEDLLALEAAPGDAEAVNRVFRAFHTLKGSVGLFDFPPWFALLHAAEDERRALLRRDLDGRDRIDDDGYGHRTSLKAQVSALTVRVEIES